jgi:hypothetical protein
MSNQRKDYESKTKTGNDNLNSKQRSCTGKTPVPPGMPCKGSLRKYLKRRKIRSGNRQINLSKIKK